LKRRIASLDPISAIVFQKQVIKKDETETWQARCKSLAHYEKSAGSDSDPSSASDEDPSPISKDGLDEVHATDEDGKFSPLQCLFCNDKSASLDANLIHMSHVHSFFIPDAEYLIDMESFLSHLFALVSVFHECIFCGSSKATKVGAQDHMRGKGHCRIDLEDEEHGYRDFYDFSGVGDDEEVFAEGVTLVPDEDELRLPSGKILGHRSHARNFRQNHPHRNDSASSSRQQALTEGETEPVPIESKDRRIATRAGTSTSLIGISASQQRALIVVEKKMLQLKTRASNEYQSVLERGGNKQKTFRVKSMGKKAGGLEKRLG